jgi:hypothetical protein
MSARVAKYSAFGLWSASKNLPEYQMPQPHMISRRESRTKRIHVCCQEEDCCREYLARMLGHPGGEFLGPHVPSFGYMAWAWLGSFSGVILLWILVDFGNEISGGEFGLASSFGATAVLLFGVPQAPFAQPWNVIGGSTISALIGVFVREFVGEPSNSFLLQGLKGALAVSLAITAMVRACAL